MNLLIIDFAMECKPKTHAHSLAPTQKKGVKNLVETRRNLNK